MRKVKDAVDLGSGEKIYFRGHAQATYMSDGRTVEEAVSQGGGKTSVFFLDNESLQGLPFGYVGGTYQSYQFDGKVNEEIDLGQIAEYYYNNIAFSYEDKLYEFKITDLKSEGASLGTILVRVNDDYHLIVKPFAPRAALLGWRTYGDRTKMPSAWVEGGGSGGGSYDDTGIKKDISDLKANDALQDAELAKLSEEVGGLSERVDELGQPIFKAEYGVTTYEEIKAAYESGKVVHCDYNEFCYVLVSITTSSAFFNIIRGSSSYMIYCNADDSKWYGASYYLEQSTNKTTALSESSTDTQYPSAKAVYEALQNLPQGGGGEDTSLREAIFGKTTSKEFAINGYHAVTADTLAVNIAQGEVFNVRVDSLGAEISKFTINVKYVGASSYTQISSFSLNKNFSIYAIQDIAEVSVGTSSTYVSTKGNVRLSVTQGGLSQPYNFMNLGEVNVAENMTSLNVLEKIPALLKFKRIKVLCEFKYTSDRAKNGIIALNDDSSNAIAIDNLFQSATTTCYILDITLDQFRIDAYVECHSNSFGNIQMNDGNQGRNFGKTIIGNNISTFIINLTLLAGDKFTFYGK
jgi:hypothetical protein